MPELQSREIRPEDLRHEYAHALAEMVKDLHVVAASVSTAQSISKEILDGALSITSESITHLKAASAEIKSSVQAAHQTLDENIKQKTGDLMLILSEAVNVFRNESKDNVLRLAESTLAANVAATEAEAARASANDARMKLIDYRRELELYKLAVDKSCREALAKAVTGPTLWARVQAVFYPNKAVVVMPRAPVQPMNKPSK